MSVLSPARIRTLAAAALGSAVFLSLGLPLPLLLGPMLGCLVFALAGAGLQGMGTLGTLFRAVLGVAIGSAVTPDLVQSLPSYGFTLALVPVFVVVIGCVGYPFFRRVMGFDHPTAFYSAMPGGLQDMLIFGEEAGGDLRAMSLIHATRVLVLVSAAPFLLTLIYDLDLTSPPGAPASEVPLGELSLMVFAAIGGWKLAERVGLFGASILGPLIVTAGLSLSGLIHVRPPAEAIWAAQFFIGLSVGANYTGITGRELRVDVGAGLAYSLLLAVISIAFIEAILQFSSAGTLDVILAFLPGGQAEMAIIAIVAGADVAFVVAHHLLRVFLVILTAPHVARWFDR
jgi:membrane AbrB-like protein